MLNSNHDDNNFIIYGSMVFTQIYILIYINILIYISVGVDNYLLTTY